MLKKQWGIYTGSVNRNPAITYPLPFSDADKIAVIIGKNDGCGAAFCPNTTNISTATFGLSMYDGGTGTISWLALGD